jgi:O-antigen/teichoic acid export membrane protein
MRSCTWASFRRLVQTSLPVTLFQIAALLVNESQQLILARKANLSTVANYAILMRIALVVSTFISLGTTAFLPAFREAQERGDRAWLKRAFRRMVGARIAIAGTAGCAMVLLGNHLVRVWLHRSDIRFEVTIWVLLAVGLCAATWVNAFTDYMSALDDIWRQVLLGFISGVVSISLSLWLTPQHGILGALVATYFVAIVFWSWIIPLMVKNRQTAPATSVEHV